MSIWIQLATLLDTLSWYFVLNVKVLQKNLRLSSTKEYLNKFLGESDL